MPKSLTRTRVSIHQPAFNAWLGYYDKILWSDVFVYLDTVQFEKNSFINRNKMKLQSGQESWMTIPVKIKGHMNSSILDLEIDMTQKWKKKHLSTLLMNYKKAPFYNKVMEYLEPVYERNETNFSQFCYSFLLMTLDFFRIETQVIKSSELDVAGVKSDLVLNICKKLKASEYLSGVNGRDYLQEDDFLKNNIVLSYQDFHHPSYDQYKGHFMPFMGILDFMFNEKRDLKEVIKGSENV